MARLSRGSRNFLIALVVGIVAVVVAVLLIGDQLNPLGDNGVEPGQPVELTVEPGQSVRAVGERLVELGVVSSGLRFRVAAEDADLASVLQPGTFALETGMSNDEAIEVLAAGPTEGVGNDVRFTVQEGLTVDQTLARLAEQFDDHTVEDFRTVLDERTAAGSNTDGVLQLPDWVPEPAEVGDEVLEPYEGLLFPQTYDVRRDATARDVLQRMVDELARAADGVDEAERDALEARGLSRYEGLILSSLIERETRVDDERETVSGVIANRLEDGMRLQIDATVLYARGEPTDRVLIEDTQIDSPYNTYQVDGLPPTPISGVGNASFLAAYRPGETTARYYVLAPECDGTHRFADTLDEHNENVRAFRATDGCGVAAD
ncbi:endolytic transglycosylase MltG [Nitriliruptor alkaliphilus]|uniref:endolytic transglycosylase MltG n=1 Tax=Nitriliruptor alkaliphilus TaxID=427918 RepID=UPI00069711B1|nr:endolytic transglycosylase MltG [Nitriliruptor alkaliphilus]